MIPLSVEIRAIAVDIDGTLTDPRRRVSCPAIEALRRVVDRGITVMLVTGNVLPIAFSLRHYLGMNGPVIAENGGIAWYGEKLKLFASRDESLRAFEHLSRHMSVESIFSDRWRETEVAISQDADIEKIRELVRDFDVKVVPTGWAFHIMHKDVDKSTALSFVCDNWLNLDMREVAAIGDSDNDARMIELAGHGMTLENGSRKCKDKADFVASKPDGEGIVEILRMLGFD